MRKSFRLGVVMIMASSRLTISIEILLHMLQLVKGQMISTVQSALVHMDTGKAITVGMPTIKTLNRRSAMKKFGRVRSSLFFI